MTTIVWNRMMTTIVGNQMTALGKEKSYHVVIDGDQSVINEILLLESVKEKKFTYRALKKPTTMYYHGKSYRIWYMKGV